MAKDSAEPGAKQSLKHSLRQLALVLSPFDDGRADGCPYNVSLLL